MRTPHHRQAVEMAELAGRIEAAQGPEIRTMGGWLTDWGVRRAWHARHDVRPGHGGAPWAQRAAFDRAFLTLMIQHHDGAVAMAKQERADGRRHRLRPVGGDRHDEATPAVGLLPPGLWPPLGSTAAAFTASMHIR
ncbi:DUF305 domain-containing protein [Streptosporangium saharense]|uniref:DUF305 domain-containing protein n=1 Tax=Streptosporangium saharense TaxID=1706840 RepID=UPI003695388E